MDTDATEMFPVVFSLVVVSVLTEERLLTVEYVYASLTNSSEDNVVFEDSLFYKDRCFFGKKDFSVLFQSKMFILLEEKREKEQHRTMK